MSSRNKESSTSNSTLQEVMEVVEPQVHADLEQQNVKSTESLVEKKGSAV